MECRCEYTKSKNPKEMQGITIFRNHDTQVKDHLYTRLLQGPLHNPAIQTEFSYLYCYYAPRFICHWASQPLGHAIIFSIAPILFSKTLHSLFLDEQFVVPSLKSWAMLFMTTSYWWCFNNKNRFSLWKILNSFFWNAQHFNCSCYVCRHKLLRSSFAHKAQRLQAGRQALSWLN